MHLMSALCVLFYLDFLRQSVDFKKNPLTLTATRLKLTFGKLIRCPDRLAAEKKPEAQSSFRVRTEQRKRRNRN